jgi:Spy/CpxP family protein refolding chaperone
MEKLLARMQSREQFMTARLDAVKTFYAVLTPTQQKTFDAAFAHGPFGGHHHHHRHDASPDEAATAK